MATIKINKKQTLVRVKDNLEAIGGELLDNSGTAIDLTGKTILFRMVNVDDGTVKVNNQSATIQNASAGQVSYAPTSGDTDTVGKYAAYFIIDDSTDQWFPFDGAKFLIEVVDENERWPGFG